MPVALLLLAGFVVKITLLALHNQRIADGVLGPEWASKHPGRDGYSLSRAQVVPIESPSPRNVRVGTSLRLVNAAGVSFLAPGVLSSDPKVLAPALTDPAGFVALSPGIARVTGSYIEPGTGRHVTSTFVVEAY